MQPLGPPEPPTQEVLALITEEKAAFIEEQANKMYDFILESREILTREAHTTLQWLFAIVIGAAGYLVTLCAKQYDPHPIDPAAFWWVILPLAFVVFGSAFEAGKLVSGALRATSLYPKGNDPKNLAKTPFVSYSTYQMRFLEAWLLHDRIKEGLAANKSVGEVINRARARVVSIPVLALILLFVLGALSWSGVPWWSAILTALVCAVLSHSHRLRQDMTRCREFLSRR